MGCVDVLLIALPYTEQFLKMCNVVNITWTRRTDFSNGKLHGINRQVGFQADSQKRVYRIFRRGRFKIDNEIDIRRHSRIAVQHRG